MGMIKVVVDGGGTELLKSQAEKKIYKQSASELQPVLVHFCSRGHGPFSLVQMSGCVRRAVLCCLGLAGVVDRGLQHYALARGHPRAILSVDAHSNCPCRAAICLSLAISIQDTANPPPALPSRKYHGMQEKTYRHTVVMGSVMEESSEQMFTKSLIDLHHLADAPLRL